MPETQTRSSGKNIKVIVTRTGTWSLISPCDQKRLLLLSPSYPKFLGTGCFKRSLRPNGAQQSTEDDSGISEDSESDTEPETSQECCAADMVGMAYQES